MADVHSLHHFVASSVAAGVSLVLLHPLDVVRTRMSVHDGSMTHAVQQYRGTWHALTTIGKVEGIQGLYKGLVPAAIGTTLSWGMYMTLYQRLKLVMTDSARSSYANNFLASTTAGVITTLATNPLWLIKTRLELETRTRSSGPRVGVVQTVRSLVANEGVFALWKGLSPALMLTMHGAIQMVAYEHLKSIESTTQLDRFLTRKDVSLSSTSTSSINTEAALNGSLSKAVAVLVTYPLQVLRARMQQKPILTSQGQLVPVYSGLVDCAVTTFSREGMRGFYKGLVPHLWKVIPPSGIMFVIYESLITAMTSRASDT